MLGLTDPKDPAPRLFRLVAVDVSVVLAVTTLVQLKVIALRPWAVACLLLLFILNFIITRTIFLKAINTSSWIGGAQRARRLLWVPALAFTLAWVVAALGWVRRPDIPSGVGLVVGILITSYIWFLLIKVRSGPKNGHRG
jgi:hypothetical protein